MYILKEVRGWGKGTWVADVMDSSCYNHGQKIHVRQILTEIIIGQKASQALSDISCMRAIVIRIVLVGSLHFLQNKLTGNLYDFPDIIQL